VNELNTVQWLLAGVVALPGLAFLVLSIGWMLGWTPIERTIAQLTGLISVLECSFAVALAWNMYHDGQAQVLVRFGNWFGIGSYSFPLDLLADWISLPLIILALMLAGLIGAFSRRYLHRDRGFHRFYVLLHLFTFGAVLVYAAGSFDLLVAGWELVGITSVLLVAFFYERPDPVRSALRVFAIYRVCDLGLLWGVYLIHHRFETSVYGTVLAGGLATPAICGMLIWAAAGKSAQIPFSGWLPRAMEGPTPSSAIFYGAISVHLGAYLLLRCEPLLRSSPIAAWVLVALGLGTAIHGTLVGRACADAKTSLAYASLAQLGLIFAEAGMGWSTLALIHVIGHGCTRTLQFLRAPSMLHDYHQVHAASGGHLEVTSFWQLLAPLPIRNWLYRLALDRGHHDTVLDRLFVAPVLGIAKLLRRATPEGQDA
jgi:NAD(P)H-quinone oxidoreductase subunit 5